MLQMGAGEISHFALRLFLLGLNQTPCIGKMAAKFVVGHLRQLNPNPSAFAHKRRIVILFRRLLEQRSLQSRLRGDPYADVSVIVVIVGEHAENALADKECRLTVGDLFRCLRQRQADLPYPRDLGIAGAGFPGGFLLRGLFL